MGKFCLHWGGFFGKLWVLVELDGVRYEDFVRHEFAAWADAF